MARGVGVALGVACFGIVFGLGGGAAAQKYIPDGPDVPTVTLNEDQSGGAGLPPLPVPPPKPWDQESIWNMKVVGFQDNQGRPSSDDGWIENQNGRYILYMTNSPGTALNPQTGKVENNGTSLIDVTDPTKPVFLHHIPTVTQGGSTHVAVCSGNILPHAEKNHWYMLRHDGSTNQEVWDVTSPTAPVRLEVLISGLIATHHDWWECDTGVAYTISQTKTDGWHESGSHQHVYIYDLSNPAKPVLIRQFGLVGQQPSADRATAKSCHNNPGPNCYEGVTNPPGGVHQVYSAGVVKNRVYLPYGVDSAGVFQIVDRKKLLTGCTVPTASPKQPDAGRPPRSANQLHDDQPQPGWTHLDPDLWGANPRGAAKLSRRQTAKMGPAGGHLRRDDQ
jgi:hypothetical protein